MATTTAESWQDWVERNPLRRWRKAHGWSMMRMAGHLHVSMTIVQLWEKGVHVPSEENLAKVHELLGVGAVDEWSRWINSKPTD